MNCLSLVEHIIRIVLTLIHTRQKYREDEEVSMMNLTKRRMKYLPCSMRGSYGVRKTSIICITPFSHNWTWKTIREYIQNITT